MNRQKGCKFAEQMPLKHKGLLRVKDKEKTFAMRTIQKQNSEKINKMAAEVAFKILKIIGCKKPEEIS